MIKKEMANTRKIITKKDYEFQASKINQNKLGWFESADNGSFRICVRDKSGKIQRSYIASHTLVASLTVDGVTYCGFSSYFEGSVPTLQVLILTNKLSQ